MVRTPVLQLVRRARTLFLHNGITIARPLISIQVPLGAIAAVSTAMLYATVFSDQKIPTSFADFQNEPTSLALAFVLISWAWALFLVVGVAGTVLSSRDAALDTRRPNVECLDPAFTRMGGLVGMGLIWAVAFILSPFAIVTIVGLPFLVFFLLRLSLMFHAYMLESIGGFAAISRSWHLTAGELLRLLGLFVSTLPLILANLAIAFVTVSAVAVVVDVSGLGSDRTRTLIENGLAIFLFGIIFVASAVTYLTTSLTVFYLDLTKAKNDVRNPA